jgi:hypothetical protein
MRYRNNNWTPGEYRSVFFYYLDQIAPEIFEGLKALTPKYRAVFDSMSYLEANDLTWLFVADPLLVVNPNDAFFLSELTGNYRYNIPENDFSEAERVVIKNFHDLRQGFAEFIHRFHLDVAWLKEILFDMQYGLLRDPERFSCFCRFGYSYTSSTDRSHPFVFRVEGWSIEDKSETFEEDTLEEFKKQLQDYIQNAQVEFKNKGYLRYKKRELNRVKWLIYWNLSDVQHLWEITPHVPEFERSNLNHSKVRKSYSNKFWSAFKQFKSYDLPVRDWERLTNISEK